MEAELEQYVDAILKLHGVRLDENIRAEVLNQFNLLKSMQQIVNQEELSDDIESAGIFRL